MPDASAADICSGYAELISRHLDYEYDTKESFSHEWTPDSLLAEEALQTEDLMHAEGPWGPAQLRWALGMADLSLAAADGYLEEMARWIKKPTSALAVYLLSRSAIECMGRCWWFLEPGIGARRRVLRALLELQSSNLELRNAHQSFDKNDPEKLSPDFFEAAVADVYARARFLGFDTGRSPEGEETIKGRESRPGKTKIFSQLVEASGNPNGKAFHDLLSAKAHGGLYALDSQVIDLGSTATSGVNAVLRPSLVEASSICHRTIRARISLFDRWVDAFGYPKEPWLELRDDTDQKLEHLHQAVQQGP